MSSAIPTRVAHERNPHHEAEFRRSVTLQAIRWPPIISKRRHSRRANLSVEADRGAQAVLFYPAENNIKLG
jgi:hypothetical protein